MSFIKRFSLCCIITLVGDLSIAKEIIVGKAYPIEERSAIDEMKDRASSIDWQHHYKEMVDKIPNKKGVHLPFAEIDKEIYTIPHYALEKEIVDENHNIIYSKGYAFNVLDYAPMQFRFVVISDHPKHLEWFKEQQKNGDTILISGASAYRISEKIKQEAYELDQKMIDTFGLVNIPAIVDRDGNQFRVREFGLDYEN